MVIHIAKNIVMQLLDGHVLKYELYNSSIATARSE